MDHSPENPRRSRSPLIRWALAILMTAALVGSFFLIRSATIAFLVEEQGEVVRARILALDCEGGTWTLEVEGAERRLDLGTAQEGCEGRKVGGEVELRRIPGDDELVLPGGNHKPKWLLGALLGITGIFGLAALAFTARKKVRE